MKLGPKNLSKPFQCKQIFAYSLILFLLFGNSKLLIPKGEKGKTLKPCVSILFQFDPQITARPYRIFLLKEKEFYDDLSNEIALNRVQLYKTGKEIYDFYNVKPGIYWVGVSFLYLSKKWKQYEVNFIRPAITTGPKKDSYNRIEVRQNKRIIIHYSVEIAFTKRFNEKEDPVGFHKFEERNRPKTSEEELMLDEIYCVQDGMISGERERKKTKNTETLKVSLGLLFFDDYPLNDSNRK